jgi:hypothetical protein
VILQNASDSKSTLSSDRLEHRAADEQHGCRHQIDQMRAVPVVDPEGIGARIGIEIDHIERQRRTTSRNGSRMPSAGLTALRPPHPTGSAPSPEASPAARSIASATPVAPAETDSRKRPQDNIRADRPARRNRAPDAAPARSGRLRRNRSARPNTSARSAGPAAGLQHGQHPRKPHQQRIDPHQRPATAGFRTIHHIHAHVPSRPDSVCRDTRRNRAARSIAGVPRRSLGYGKGKSPDGTATVAVMRPGPRTPRPLPG